MHTKLQNLLVGLDTSKSLSESKSANLSSIKGYIPNIVLDKFAEVQHNQKNSLDLLTAHIAKCDKFLSSEEVQKRVELDFNSKNFSQFDPNNGDRNCEGRVFLYEIFHQNQLYEHTSSEFKLVLTICHILKNFKKLLRDDFGLIYKIVDCDTTISYEKLGSCSGNQRASLKFKSTELKSSPFSSAKLLGHVLNYISSSYLISHASMIDLTLKLDLKPIAGYEDDNYKKIKNIPKPLQHLNGAITFTYFEILKKLQAPILFKITSLIASSSSLQLQKIDFLIFKFEGSTFKRVEEGAIESEAAISVYEGHRIENSASQNNSFKKIEDDIFNYVIAHAVKFDSTEPSRMHNPSNYHFTKLTEIFNQFDPEFVNRPEYYNTHEQSYTLKPTNLNITHSYVSSLREERELRNTIIQTCIKNNKYLPEVKSCQL